MNLKTNFIPKGNFNNNQPIFMSNYGLHSLPIYHPTMITPISNNKFTYAITYKVRPNINNFHSPIELYNDEIYLKIKNIDLYTYSRLNKKNKK